MVAVVVDAVFDEDYNDGDDDDRIKITISIAKITTNDTRK
jgi:hypothetical protein